MTQCIRYIITGRVQGVFFRASTQHQAQRLKISGHAKNLANGDVEVLACGEAQALQQLAAWLAHGPEYARVDNVSSETITLPDIPKGFATL